MFISEVDTYIYVLQKMITTMTNEQSMCLQWDTTGVIGAERREVCKYGTMSIKLLSKWHP